MSAEIGEWDPVLTERLVNAAAPIAKRWFRFEVRGLESLPTKGGALVVANHSGGMLTPDVLIFASAFYGEFGYDRPLYTLGNDGMFAGPMAGLLTRLGVIHASTRNAANALRSGRVVLVFPGGIYDAYRPTLAENVIDFNGRTGYVGSATYVSAPRARARRARQFTRTSVCRNRSKLNSLSAASTTATFSVCVCRFGVSLYSSIASMPLSRFTQPLSPRPATVENKILVRHQKW